MSYAQQIRWTRKHPNRQWEAELLVRRVVRLDRATFMVGYELAAQELAPEIRKQALGEGRQVGLEEAAKECEKQHSIGNDNMTDRELDCADAIRALKKKT